MLLNVICWNSNVIVAPIFVTQMQNTTPSSAFGFCAGVCFFSRVGVHFYYSHVKEKTLDDIHEVFRHGLGIKYAREKQEEAKRCVQGENMGDCWAGVSGDTGNWNVYTSYGSICALDGH